MPHQVMGRHLGRTSAERRSLFRNLMTDLFRYDRIETTEAKAKAIRGEAEKLITRAKRGEGARLVALAQNGETEALEKLAAQVALHARRIILRDIHDKAVVDRLIHEIAATHID